MSSNGMTKQKKRFPKSFTDNYPGAATHVIGPANIEEFIYYNGEPNK